MDNPGKLAT